MPTLEVRGLTGTVCIYEGADNVVNNPLADLSRVMFHSDLQYPSVIAIQDRTITLPSRSVTPATPWFGIHTLFAHGRPGIPFVFGYITNLGNLSLAGSVPLDSDIPFYGRFVTLGADGTNVVLHENTISRSGTVYNARAINVRVHITDLIL